MSLPQMSSLKITPSTFKCSFNPLSHVLPGEGAHKSANGAQVNTVSKH